MEHGRELSLAKARVAIGDWREDYDRPVLSSWPRVLDAS